MRGRHLPLTNLPARATAGEQGTSQGILSATHSLYTVFVFFYVLSPPAINVMTSTVETCFSYMQATPGGITEGLLPGVFGGV